MTNLDPAAQWLLLAFVAWASFMIGRATANRTSAEERRMRRENEEQEASEAFASLPSSVHADVDRLLLDGKLIEAIKLIREHTSLGLKDSKLAADQRRRQIKP
jgi:ribosomal protein L7/L12